MRSHLMASFLVTGGTGQIGTYVCEELLREGHKVVCYDFKPNTENISHIANKLTVIGGDVVDLNELTIALRQHDVSHIIHLAAFLVLESMQRPAKAVQVNCMGTNNVFEAARMLDIQRTVYASSISVYGSPNSRRPGIVDEDDYPNCPSDPYSFTKQLTEQMGKFYGDTYGMDLVCLRLAAAWGPGRYRGYTGQFNDFVKSATTGKRTKLPDDFAYRNAKYRWFYVKDMGRCFTFVAQVDKSRVKRHLYNAGLAEPFNSRDVVNSIREVVRDSEIEFKELDTPTKLSATIAGPSGLDIDCSRFYQDLGFSIKYSLNEAIRDMANFERGKLGIGLV